MLFEDLTDDVGVPEAAQASHAARLPLLDAYWQYLLSSPREAEPPAQAEIHASTPDISIPDAVRELTAA
jgi:hypothetical protein